MPTLASKSFKTQKVLPGKQYRDGTLGDALAEVYRDVDAGFAQLETIANVGFEAVRFAYAANVAALATADKTPDGATAVVAGDRVLLTAQTNGWENGIYDVGVVTGTCVLTRATDLDTEAEVALGQSVWVTEGTTYANTEWRVTELPSTWDTAGSLTFTLQSAGAFIPLSIIANRNDIIVGSGVGTVTAVTLAETHLLGRSAGLHTASLPPADVRTILTCDSIAKTSALLGANTIAETRLVSGAPSTTVLGVKRSVAIPVLFSDIAAAADALFGPTLPINAVVTRAYYMVTTPFTSATNAATIGIGFAADDVAGIVGTIAISDGTNPWAAGPHETTQSGAITAAANVLTAARQVQFVRGGGEVLTAGAMVLFLDYVLLA